MSAAPSLATPAPPEADRGPEASPEASALAAALSRLDELIEAENAALGRRAVDDLREIAHRKSRSLLELTRLSRATASIGDRGALRARMQELRGKLARNEALLKLHLAAAREIADIRTAALGAAEWDGTYSRPRHKEDGR
jgi:hypothetical protein